MPVVDAGHLDAAIKVLGDVMLEMQRRQLLMRPHSDAAKRLLNKNPRNDHQLGELASRAFEAGATELARIGFPGAVVHSCRPDAMEPPATTVPPTGDELTRSLTESHVTPALPTDSELTRHLTRLAPLDHVLDGGLVRGATILLTFPPDIPASVLTLQVLNSLQQPCLYVTGLGTRAEVAAVASKAGAVSGQIYVLEESNLEKILRQARTMNPHVIAIDTIQDMTCPDIHAPIGSKNQLRNCMDRLIGHAWETKTTLWILSRGPTPTVLEHSADVVLELRADPTSEDVKILSCPKNRFGAPRREGGFNLKSTGFVPVSLDEPTLWRLTLHEPDETKRLEYERQLHELWAKNNPAEEK